jgi:3D (Asp-Asp-Asp) domain-containing protein
MDFKTKVAGILIFIASGIQAQVSPNDFSFPAPENKQVLKAMDLWATQYYIPEFSSAGTIPIVYANGEWSGLYADTCDFCTASLEGTAYVRDSLGNIHVINFARTGDRSFVDCRTCKKYAGSTLKVENWGKALWNKSAGFGDGVKNYFLVPFRTIAVDQTAIPYGSVIFIPAAKGKLVSLPNGKQATHDGYFFAGDTGGAIKKNHIDVFTGISSGNPFPLVIQSDENQPFEAILITDPEIIHTLTLLHVKQQ